MTDKYFAPLGDEPTPLDSFEDEFTRALHAQPDTAVTESWAARAASLPRLIRRRRTARVTGSIAASVALVLGATLAVAQIPTSVTTPPPPANPVPMPTHPETPLKISCTTTLEQALNAPIAVDGFTLTDFNVDVDGVGSAVLKGPNSGSATVDAPRTDAAPSVDDENFDPEGLGTLWFPLADTDLPVPNPEVFSSSALNPALVDPASVDPDLKPNFGSFPLARTTTPSSLRTSEKRSMSGEGLSVGNQQLRPCYDSEDPNSLWLAGWPSLVTGTYAVVGFGYVARVGPDRQSSWDKREALIAERIVIVSVKESTVTAIARPVREGAISVDSQQEHSETGDEDGSTSQAVSWADGSPTVVAHSTPIDPTQTEPDDYLIHSDGLPSYTDPSLVEIEALPDGRWIMMEGEPSGDRSGELRIGVWDEDVGFTPWRLPAELVDERGQWNIGDVATTPSNPGQVVLSVQTEPVNGDAPFAIVAVDLASGEGHLVVSSNEKPDSHAEGPSSITYDGDRVYWSERAGTGINSGKFVVYSRDIAGTEIIRTEGVDVSDPHLTPHGIAVALRTDDGDEGHVGRYAGIGWLRDGEVEPLTNFATPISGAELLKFSDDYAATELDGRIYVIPLAGTGKILALDDTDNSHSAEFSRFTGQLFWTSVDEETDTSSTYLLDPRSAAVQQVASHPNPMLQQVWEPEPGRLLLTLSFDEGSVLTEWDVTEP